MIYCKECGENVVGQHPCPACGCGDAVSFREPPKPSAIPGKLYIYQGERGLKVTLERQDEDYVEYVPATPEALHASELHKCLEDIASTGHFERMTMSYQEERDYLRGLAQKLLAKIRAGGAG